MTAQTPPPSITPTPLPASATGSTHRGSRVLVHRVRLEHLAVELLRLADALRLPVPIETVWRRPPQALWNPVSEAASGQGAAHDDDPYRARWLAAVAIARAVGGSTWVAKVRLMGAAPFSDADCQVFARALLMPTPLIGRLSERQKSPELVHTIFQAPMAEAKVRLQELGL